MNIPEGTALYSNLGNGAPDLIASVRPLACRTFLKNCSCFSLQLFRGGAS